MNPSGHPIAERPVIFYPCFAIPVDTSGVGSDGQFTDGIIQWIEVFIRINPYVCNVLGFVFELKPFFF